MIAAVRLAAAKHQPVPDRLDLLGRVLLEHPANAPLEREDHLERPVIALQLGERREPDQIREQEGVGRRDHLRYHPVCKSHTGWYVNYRWR